MAGASDAQSNNLTGAGGKILRLLVALRDSEAGAMIYGQVERMLADLQRENQDAHAAYAAIAESLLEVLAQNSESGSSQQVRIRLLQNYLQPPLSVAELQALQQAARLCAEQADRQPLDAAAINTALQPLLDAFTVGSPEAADRPLEEDAAAPAEAEGGSETQRAVLRRESAYEETAGHEYALASESRDQPETQDEHALRRQGINKLQADLTQHILDTISQNQEFGVLLEVVLNELNQADRMDQLEDLRWTLVREVERLMSGHHELAEKLDHAHQYLRVLESDSRQLSDELSRVRMLSLTDELTGLSNRRAFLRRLEDEVARVQRYGFPLTMALIDLDKFKNVNDIYGHAAGDEVLRVYSKNILSIFRHHDLVARYGGEEFAVLLPNTDIDGAVRALNKVRERCQQTHWKVGDEVHPVPTFSAGLALYKPGETSSAFIERVDKALYQAKRLGRNRIEVDASYPINGDRASGPQSSDDVS